MKKMALKYAIIFYQNHEEFHSYIYTELLFCLVLRNKYGRFQRHREGRRSGGHEEFCKGLSGGLEEGAEKWMRRREGLRSGYFVTLTLPSILSLAFLFFVSFY